METQIVPLSCGLNTPSLDKTELKGDFAFLLHYAQNVAPASTGAPGAAADLNAAPTVFTAVQSQLNLKLEPRAGKTAIEN